MRNFDIETVDADGETYTVEAVDSAFLLDFFAALLDNSDILEVGGTVTVKVVK